MEFVVNGVERSVDVPADMPLLWVLRDTLGITGPKYGCGEGLCGACMVLMDGERVHACQVTPDQCAGKAVVTVEGQTGPIARAVMAAWDRTEAAQCGFCQPGQITSACALLARVPRPSDEEIDAAMRHNLCRCGTYARMRQAIHLAAAELAGATRGEEASHGAR